MLERGLGERVVEPLPARPGPVAQRPRRLPLPVDAPVAQEPLADPVAGGRTRPARVVAAAHEVTQTQALLRGCRRTDEGELAGPVEADQLVRVAPVGLDPVARPDRCERGRNDVAGDGGARQQPVEVIAAGAGLGADGDSAGVAEPPHEPADGLLLVHDLDELRLTALGRDDRGGDRVLVHVERDKGAGRRSGSVRANVRHGWFSFPVGGPGRSGHSTSATLTRDRYGRENQPSRVHVD